VVLDDGNAARACHLRCFEGGLFVAVGKIDDQADAKRLDDHLAPKGSEAALLAGLGAQAFLGFLLAVLEIEDA